MAKCPTRKEPAPEGGDQLGWRFSDLKATAPSAGNWCTRQKDAQAKRTANPA
jgi:hypothetical protein